MALLYGDHNVSRPLVLLFRELGHAATNARALGLDRGSDGTHLLFAAERGWILLTHNERDFLMLHDAWLRWSWAWQVAPRHAGILVLPQRSDWKPPRLVSEIETLLAANPVMTNQLFAWRASRGWVPFAEITPWSDVPSTRE